MTSCPRLPVRLYVGLQGPAGDCRQDHDMAGCVFSLQSIVSRLLTQGEFLVITVLGNQKLFTFALEQMTLGRLQRPWEGHDCYTCTKQHPPRANIHKSFRRRCWLNVGLRNFEEGGGLKIFHN